MSYSKNDLAERIVGKRDIPDNVIILDEPCELGFHCPVCDYEIEVDGEFDMRLTWSEYNGFIYCYECNKDYPSCFCIPLTSRLPYYVSTSEPIDYAIWLYLKSIEDGKGRI